MGEYVLKSVGYWQSKYLPEYSDYPHPQKLVQQDWHAGELSKIISYLRAGNVYRAYLGGSYCRFGCSPETVRMGTCDLIDGEWLWPEGLAHYIENHSVILPEEFVDTMRRNNWQPSKLPEPEPKYAQDNSYWLSWAQKQGALD